MTGIILQFVLSAAVIVIGGIGLSYVADAISRRFGLGHLLGGVLLIAVATSLPDLVLGISAARGGLPNLAVGDLVGAALMNMLVLASMDLLHYSRGRMLSKAAAAHAISGTMSITLLAITGIALVLPDEMNPMFAGVSAGLWGVAAAYFFGLRLVVFDQRYAAEELARAKHAAPLPRRGDLVGPIAGYVVSAILILLAGPVLARAADSLAHATGLGNTFVGTALLPLCTTLPELVAAITAMRIRAFDLVVGNAFGSIAFNLLLLVPIDAAYPGSLMAAAAPTHVVTCLAAILTVGVAMMGQLYHAERHRRFLEPDAVLIITLILGAFGLIYALR